MLQTRSHSIFLALIVVFVSAAAHAQERPVDTVLRRNTIKLDLTSYWLYRNALVFSYERVAKPYQTWAVSGGFQQLPSLGAIDSINVTRNASASGFKVGGEYRFYLRKENKFGAPHGVYLGGYMTWHSFTNKRSIEVNNNGTLESAELTAQINIVNPGIQIGYQFVINNRWTIDLVFMGPSLSNYRAQFKLDGNYTFDPEDVQNEVFQALLNKFPGFAELLEDREVSSSGKIDTWAYGFRYQIQVGYHFGKKK